MTVHNHDPYRGPLANGRCPERRLDDGTLRGVCLDDADCGNCEGIDPASCLVCGPAPTAAEQPTIEAQARQVLAPWLGTGVSAANAARALQDAGLLVSTPQLSVDTERDELLREARTVAAEVRRHELVMPDDLSRVDRALLVIDAERRRLDAVETAVRAKRNEWSAESPEHWGRIHADVPQAIRAAQHAVVTDLDEALAGEVNRPGSSSQVGTVPS